MSVKESKERGSETLRSVKDDIKLPVYNYSKILGTDQKVNRSKTIKTKQHISHILSKCSRILRCKQADC